MNTGLVGLFGEGALDSSSEGGIMLSLLKTHLSLLLLSPLPLFFRGWHSPKGRAISRTNPGWVLGRS